MSANHAPALLTSLALLLASVPAAAQTRRPATRPAASAASATAERAATDTTKDPNRDPGQKPKSSFGTTLSAADARALLGEMRQLTEQALASSRSAEKAASVAEVKSGAERVLQSVWGDASARGEGQGPSEITVPGWKERWQVTGGEFDTNYAKRLGTTPPRITDPRKLGTLGRGRAVRARLEQITRTSSASPVAQKASAQQAVASLSNVVGWMYVTTGLKQRESQPRISLTHVWDAPAEFWQGSSDTGWLDEAYSQAVNILKTDYGTDVAEARRHAAGMSELLVKVLNGVDADRNGTVEPKMMEGGLLAAQRAAGEAGL